MDRYGSIANEIKGDCGMNDMAVPAAFRSRWLGAPLANLPPDLPPLLLVVIDTEEDFDWTLPFDRNATGTQSIQSQNLAQHIFDRYSIRPTYVVDYPVAATAKAAPTLRRFLDEGRCQIGTHLHPWVNPPHDETVSQRNSYPGNLEPSLERRKLEALTAAIESAFGVRPVLYKAGRYGLGAASSEILQDLGYEVDLSIVPHTSFAGDHGPDFVGLPDRPFWFGEKNSLLAIPLSRGFVGLARRCGPALHLSLTSPLAARFHLAGIAARTGMLERITLSPEGFTLDEQCRLARALVAGGHKVFSLTYHSPSLTPGNTPYVRTERDLDIFLKNIEGFVRFFLEELGGRPSTPMEIKRIASAP